ncbi:hypothetical protein GYMLUDRAFT_170773 [Collybiopsis luxurians FD-317 M1]|uniref:Uncharacterized protein n=1 Tax=Collybiopsis luxurians FD-317 M1 TaxID=944289 RepID=A0A0D0BTC5_9AGAR|nr:hypothetical protein GYMLUDRAFT_170773 [Collybiopsis luxurians FD-317 M1]
MPRLHLFWTTAVFSISTLGALLSVIGSVIDAVVFYTAVQSQDFGPLEKFLTQDETKTILTVFKLTQTFVQIYRIYHIWECRFVDIVILILICLATNSIGLAGSIMLTKGFSDTAITANFELALKGTNYLFGFYYANAGVNSVLTLLIGRYVS